MRLLVAPRPGPPPLSGTVLSLTAHAAVLVAVAGGGGAPGDDPSSRTKASTDAEQLHWVGLGPGGDAPAARPRRPGLRPPLAYVVPGRGGLRLHVPAGDPIADREGERGGPRAADRGTGAGRGPATPALRPANDRRSALRLRTPAIPDVEIPDASATLLVAGVLSAAPDHARRASQPEDFASLSPSTLMADMLVRTGARAGGPRPDAGFHDLPIPLAGNPVPRYPAELARARTGGHVVVEFRIDSTGLVDLQSLRVVASTDTRFTEAVRRVLPRLRFLPAERGERAVGVTVLQPFVFAMRDPS
jgi:protein TonB